MAYVRGGVTIQGFRVAPSIVQPTYVATPPPQPVLAAPKPTVMDDYERWYTESSHTNRMLLALLSGLDDEVGWALDRLCRLCNNEQFLLSAIPGLTDALFSWPEWFVRQHRAAARRRRRCSSRATRAAASPEGWSAGAVRDRARGKALFAATRAHQRRVRHALESLFVLRNAVLNEPNARELAGSAKTKRFVLRTLKTLVRVPSLLGEDEDLEIDEDEEEENEREREREEPFGRGYAEDEFWEDDPDATEEFVLHTIEILQSIASTFSLPPPSHFDFSSTPAASQNPVPVLVHLASTSQNRATIIASLSVLSLLFTNPANAVHLSASSPALDAALRYLPLFTFQDSPLVDAGLNYLFAHMSHPPMAKAFMLHPDMPATLRLLISLMISEQVEEMTTVELKTQKHYAPVVRVRQVDYELMGEERERTGAMTEPERCYQWMRTMFIADDNAELTQVEFWNSYKDLFTPFADRAPLLVASDVIKNVSTVFAGAQAMVLPGTPQRFVIKGIKRRKASIPAERFRCPWRVEGEGGVGGTCKSDAFPGPDELLAHVQTHLDITATDASSWACKWATCAHTAGSPAALRRHMWTHIPPRADPFPTPFPHSTPLPQVAFASADEATAATASVTAPSSSNTDGSNTGHSTTVERPLIPTQRSIPPPPQTTLAYPSPAANREPPATSLTALLIVRALFRAAFASRDAAPRADADHFGFPGSIEEEDEVFEREREREREAQREREANGGEGESEREAEGERRGRKAFVSARRLLEGVGIRDAALMSWITEMVDAAYDDAQ